MADIELVIKISEEDYKFLKEGYSHLKIKEHLTDTRDNRCYIAIANGTPISKENQKTGHWVVYSELIGEWEGTKKYACDKCGEKVGVFKSNYCPNCGARMVKTDDFDMYKI